MACHCADSSSLGISCERLPCRRSLFQTPCACCPAKAIKEKAPMNIRNTNGDRTCTVGTTVMKNWAPFVFGPALAMLSVYGRSWRKFLSNSSSKSCPQIDSPPVPSPIHGMPSAGEKTLGSNLSDRPSVS